MSCEAYFAEQLRKRGFRVTAQREAVLAALHELEGLVTAEEIFERVQAQTAPVDRSTVYRTLDLLEGIGLLAVVDSGDAQRRYELLRVEAPHHHLRCTRCGAIIPVDYAVFEPLFEELRRTTGFVVTSSSLTIPGLCARCAEETSRSE